MTQLLEQALTAIAKLVPPEQDAIATILIEELAPEQRWAKSFEKSQDLLARLTDEALAEDQAGLTKPF